MRRHHRGAGRSGWIPAEQLPQLPPAALEPPREEEAISLDLVMARFFPPGTRPPVGDPEEMQRRSAGLAAAIQAHVAEQRARHGMLGGVEDVMRFVAPE